ncbi:RHS repeat domain-containing protein [Planctopirus limnophila]|uniref:RHS repeat domain-containing protein n=1 Tax=Planctopirus limnophila TaxID=120 RepID=UPI0018C2BF99|nr:RHS repeat-associated core domain-containing protein [Planctopirus limnophila]
MGQRSRLIHPGGARTTYSYDANQRMSTLVNPLSQRTTWTYDANGQVLDQLVANGTRTSYSYDAAGRTTQVIHRDGLGEPTAAYIYAYDANGRKVEMEEFGPTSEGWNGLSLSDWSNLTLEQWSTLTLSGSATGRTTWTYDPVGQLVSEAITGINEVKNSFTYDPSGNRLKLETLSDGITTSVYNAANQLLMAESLSGITTYSYDLAGNRRSVETPVGEITTYTFDVLNHNIAVELPTSEVVTYTWAPVNKANDERQIQRDDGIDITRYLWDDQVILLETDDTNVVLAENTAQPGGYGMVLSRTQDADTSFYQFDAIGSTRSLSDGTGTLTDEYSYEAFGKALAQTGSTENPYTWIGAQGYRVEEATGEYNLRARDYDPHAANFTSEDPLGLEAGDSNFYRYVGNDPVNQTDPSGKSNINYRLVWGTGSKSGELQLCWDESGVFWGVRKTKCESLGTIDANSHVTRDVLYTGGVDGKVLRNPNCKVHYTQIVEWLRDGSLQHAAENYEIDLLFYRNCSNDPQPHKPPTPVNQPSAPAGSTSCGVSGTCTTSATNCSTPAPTSNDKVHCNSTGTVCCNETKYYCDITIANTWTESALQAIPHRERLYFDRGNTSINPAWDIDWIAFKHMAEKRQARGGVTSLNKSIEEGADGVEFVAREVFVAADTADKVIIFVKKPCFQTGADVALSSLPFSVTFVRQSASVSFSGVNIDLSDFFGRKLFRADDFWDGGPVGIPLAEAALAKIQTFAEHVLRKRRNDTSRYTSFSTMLKDAKRFTDAPDNRYISKAEFDALHKLEQDGIIKIHTPESVYQRMMAGTADEVKEAKDVRDAMIRNHEILIEGQIPAGLLKRCKN